MAGNDKKPEIRFAGFTDAWEERKLSDVVSLFGGNAFYSQDSVDSGARWLKIANVGIGQLKWNNESFLPISYLDDYSSYRLKIGDYVMALTRPILNHELKVAEITEDDILLNQRVAKLIFTDDNKFGYQLLRKHSTVDRIENELAGTDPPNLSVNTLNHINVRVPNLAEQGKIGSFFANLDNLITLHQRKYDKLVIIKKSMLEKMFPKDGTNVPEIRFAGFTDAWEQRKAVEIFRTIADKNHPELPLLSASQEYGMIKREETGINIFHDKKNEATYKRVLPGQFVIHLRSFQGGFAHSNVEGITSPAYTVLDFIEKGNHYDYFWKYIFNSKNFIKRLETVTYGIRDGRSISYEDFTAMGFKFSSYPEQCRIGKYFIALDHLTTLHHHQLEKLKNIKKSLLEKMFV